MGQDEWRGIRLEGHVHRKLMALKTAQKARNVSGVIDELIDRVYPDLHKLEHDLSKQDAERQRLIDAVLGSQK